MLIMAPAVIFGIVVVFLAGVRLSYAILDDFEKMKGGNIDLGQETVQKIEILSYVGGGLAVALLITLLVFASQQWRDNIIIALTIFGILFGLFSLLNPNKGTPLPKTNDNNQNWHAYSEPKIIITCSNCSQKLRIPMQNKKVIVTCPSSRHKFKHP